MSVYEAIKAWYRLFDTARYYANEEGVWKWIKRAIEEWLVTRDELFITSKIIPDSYYDSDVAIDESLRALWLDYIDLMLIHQPWENDKELYKALEGGVKSWKIRSLWISNYYTKEAFDEITEGVEIMPAVLQNENHIYHQNTKLKEYIQQYWTILESWYPFWGRWNTEESFTNPTILKLSEKYWKTPAQIILRWQVQDGYVVIPGSSNVEHIKENIDIFDFELTPNEMKLVNMINENRRYENW